MPRAQPFQTNLTVGELSPKALARVDLPVRYAGLKRAENMLVLTQGGQTRRWGTRYVATIADVGQAFQLIGFEFSEDQQYLVVVTHLAAKIYRNDVLEQTLALPFARTDLDRLQWTQSHDTLILFDGRGVIQPQKVLRDTTQAVGAQFSVAAVTFTNIPQHAYNDASSPAEVNEVQQISFAGSWVDGEKFRLRLAGLRTEKIQYTATSALLAERIESALLALANTSADGIVVADVGSGDFNVTFTGADGNKDWDEMEVEIISDTLGSASVATLVEGASRQEPVWSATRGWPKCGVFYDARLFFGGSRSRPSTVWASRVGEFFDFDVGDALDDDAIDWTVDSDAVEEIVAVINGRNLEVLTTRSELYCPERPITPTSFSLVRQSIIGAARVRPVMLDGATVFIDRERRGVFEFLFGALQEGYATDEASLLGDHLIKDPVAMAVHHTSLAEFCWIINSDGTACVVNRRRAQELTGMTPQSTNGSFERVCALDSDLYLGVTRTINGTPRRFLEKLAADVLTDCAVTLAGTNLETWSGVNHLNGATVEVIGDGVPEGEQVVTAGVVTTSRPRDSVEVGLGFLSVLESPPFNLNTEVGPTVGQPTRLTKLTLSLLDTDDVYVNGYHVKRRTFGSHALDNPPPRLNGEHFARLRGWGRSATVTITQKRPGRLTVLAIGLEGGVG